MPGQDLPSLISKAKTGQLDALSALVEALGRDLRAFIATYAASRTMLEEVHTATWIQVRREMSQCPPNSQAITWVRQRAMAVLREQLDQERNAAISARDGVRHLIAQDGNEGLQALISPSNEGASLLNQRYSALDEATQELIARRYGDRAELSQLATERSTSEQQIAALLYQARAGLHWRATDSDRRLPEDPHLVVAIDRHLADQLSPNERQALSATLMKDLGRAASFTRQARIDLMLSAVFGDYGAEQARALAGTLVKIEHKRRNESSLLQVVAPPRTPVGSGTELRLANDRIADRQTGSASSVIAPSGATRPVPRVSGNRRRSGSDEGLLIRDRAPRSDNRTIMIIAGVVAVLGLGGLLLVWGSGGATTTVTTKPAEKTVVAIVVTTGSGNQVISDSGNSPATNGTRLTAGHGLDSARSESTVELTGSARVVLSTGTQVKSFDALPDRTGQILLTRGMIQVQVATLPGVEVRTAHGRTTFGIGRGTISVESDRTLVHAQGGSVTVAGVDTGGAMQLPPDQRAEIAAGASPRVVKPAGFVRGINLGGTPVTIDRHRWLSHREALSGGFTLGAGTSIAPPSMFSGSGLDFDRKTMLDTGLIGSGGPVQFAQVVPDGAYDLTLWLANSGNVEASRLVMTVNDQPVALGNALLKRDTWAQLGPLPVRSSKGRLELSLAGLGSARIAGVALEAPGGDTLALPAAISITSPVDAASFYAKDKINLRAEVVGKVSAVQFWRGDQKLGEAKQEPYAVVVDSLTAGDYQVVAKAINPSGEPSVSLPLSFTVLPAFGSGTILTERWTGLDGLKLSDVQDKPQLNQKPQSSAEAKEFATKIDWGDKYYCRMRGYVHAPLTGEYVFWMTSDDEGELLLSTSDDPAGARRIAYCPYAPGPREWTKESVQQSKPIPLISGQKYYIELRYKEHEGGDYGACGWKLPNGMLDRPISGVHLSPFKP